MEIDSELRASVHPRRLHVPLVDGAGILLEEEHGGRLDDERQDGARLRVNQTHVGNHAVQGN